MSENGADKIGTCGQCMFSKMRSQLGMTGLRCQCEPPKVLLLPTGQPGQVQIVGLWPMVDANEWCGRWQQDTATIVADIPRVAAIVP